MKSKRRKTGRGFVKIELDEAYGERCSLQESSSVVPHVWLGLEKAKLKHLSGNGWVEYSVPPYVLINMRMCLNRRQVKQLIKRLRKFVDTGRL